MQIFRFQPNCPDLSLYLYWQYPNISDFFLSWLTLQLALPIGSSLIQTRSSARRISVFWLSSSSSTRGMIGSSPLLLRHFINIFSWKNWEFQIEKNFAKAICSIIHATSLNAIEENCDKQTEAALLEIPRAVELGIASFKARTSFFVILKS